MSCLSHRRAAGLNPQMSCTIRSTQQSFVQRVARRLPEELSASALRSCSRISVKEPAANLRFKIRSHELHDPRHDVEDRRPFFVRAKRLAPQLRAGGKRAAAASSM